ncbi:ScyD/ScyE family protein [Agromyces laixinhei]|uniref:ScyD/ScyE family protein n=1 Tax=Agromyces laixinhei TaxID=2585717 RepID=UPI0012EE0295|nr:ScyD/ScyE family protein [Agromyces laixinhei]
MGLKRIALLGAIMTAALLSSLFVSSMASADGGHDNGPDPVAVLLASGLQGASGATIGPDGALYVGEGTTGVITRVDTETGEQSTFASGLPPAVNPIGGVIDVAFLGATAYALVTLVDPGAGGTSVSGVYRIDDADSNTVVADIGAWSIANPPPTDFFVPSGVQFAMEPVPGGFLVTDGHHNRLVFAALSGQVTQLTQFENIVPTGLDLVGLKLYIAQAGPVPHNPEDGTVVSLSLWRPTPRVVASGAPLLVDVEGSRCGLYALAQGDYPEGAPEGSPAAPGTGALVKVASDGTFDVVVDGLDRPTSLDLTRDAAFVTALDGEVWRIDGVFSGDHRWWGGCRGHG